MFTIDPISLAQAQRLAGAALAERSARPRRARRRQSSRKASRSIARTSAGTSSFPGWSAS